MAGFYSTCTVNRGKNNTAGFQNCDVGGPQTISYLFKRKGLTSQRTKFHFLLETPTWPSWRHVQRSIDCSSKNVHFFARRMGRSKKWIKQCPLLYNTLLHRNHSQLFSSVFQTLVNEYTALQERLFGIYGYTVLRHGEPTGRHQDPVVRRLVNAIPQRKCEQNKPHYQLDNDLFEG